MELRLDGKVALVTGASRGIGAAIAKIFAENGAEVMISSRKQEALERAAAQINGEVAICAAHAGEPAQIRDCVSATVNRFGKIDILVNNAATNPHLGSVIDIDLARYDKIFEVNLRGVLVWIQEAWRASMKEHGGSVINISSINGLTHGGDVGAYDVSKAALIHLTKHLATELGPAVRVNAIAPGLVKTDFARALWQQSGDQLAARWPVPRLGEADDIAYGALYLASELASWVSGHVLVVDGGAVLGGRVNPLSAQVPVG